MLVKEQEVIATRDFFWRELNSAYAKYLERITDEEIEMAYKELYGYDPSIQKLFIRAIQELKRVDQIVITRLLYQNPSRYFTLLETQRIHSKRPARQHAEKYPLGSRLGGGKAYNGNHRSIWNSDD
jgi:hypothetical protein